MTTLEANPCCSDAYLGYQRDARTGELFWRVCAWHEPSEKRAVELEAARLGLKCSHGVCPACSAKMIASITGDQT